MSNSATSTMKGGYQDLIDKGRQAQADDARVTYENKKSRREAERTKANNMRHALNNAARLRAHETRLVMNEDQAKLFRDLELNLRATLEDNLITEIREDVFSRQDEIASTYIEQIRDDTKSQLIDDLEPVVKADLRAQFAPDIKQKLMNELRVEVKEQLIEELRAEVRSQFREEHRADVLKDLMRRLESGGQNGFGDDLPGNEITSEHIGVEDQKSLQPQNDITSEHVQVEDQNLLQPQNEVTSECSQVENRKPLYPDLGIQDLSGHDGKTRIDLGEDQLKDGQAQEVFEIAPESSVPDTMNNDLPQHDVIQDLSGHDGKTGVDVSENQSKDDQAQEVFESAEESTIPDTTNNGLPENEIIHFQRPEHTTPAPSPTNLKRPYSEDDTPEISPSSLKRSSFKDKKVIANGHRANKKIIEKGLPVTKKVKVSETIDLTGEPDSDGHDIFDDFSESNAEGPAFLPSDSTFNGHYFGARPGLSEIKKGEKAPKTSVNRLLYDNITEEQDFDHEAFNGQAQGLRNQFVKSQIEGYIGNDGTDFAGYAEDEDSDYEDGTYNHDEVTLGDVNEPLGIHRQHNVTTPSLFNLGTKRSLSVEEDEEENELSETSKRSRGNRYKVVDGEHDVGFEKKADDQYSSESEQSNSGDDDEEEEEDETEEDEDVGSSVDEYSSDEPTGYGGYQVGYQGGLPQHVPRTIIKETNTQETAFQIDSSDDEEHTLVEDTGFVAVNKPMMIKEEEEDSLFVSL